MVTGDNIDAKDSVFFLMIYFLSRVFLKNNCSLKIKRRLTKFYLQEKK